MLRLDELHPAARHARSHSRAQLRALARSIEAWGFNVPILVDSADRIVAGHARVEAGRLIGVELVPAIRLEHLSKEQIEAFRIADNRLAELATWDDDVLGQILRDLSSIDLGFSLEATGFTMGEIDLKIEGLSDDEVDDEPALTTVEDGPPVSRPGDLWRLGEHRLLCADASDTTAYQVLMGGESAAMSFADPPYNVPINGHVSGKGRVKHREFNRAVGEMSPVEFTAFLGAIMALVADHSASGSLHYWCMDWRHLLALVEAARSRFGEPLNLCIWVKDRPGMGSLYRSTHELIPVFKLGRGRHRNNVQLGRFGRNRTNVWRYPAPSRISRTEDDELAALHPTVKPVGLIADAILDATARRDIVLDPFLGSGSTLLAAEKVGRRCRGLDLDPLYVDLAIRRWSALTGGEAVHGSSGQTFSARAKGGQP
jgi:DNA modification methylase